jgi:hypothetical protein
VCCAVVATIGSYTSTNQQSWEQRSWEERPNGALTYPKAYQVSKFYLSLSIVFLSLLHARTRKALKALEFARDKFKI